LSARPGSRRRKAAAAAAALAPVLLFGLLQTPAARELIVSELGAYLSRETGGPVKIGGLSGLVPFAFSVETLSFSDEGGPWLEAEGISVAASPAALARGRVGLSRVRIEALRWRRPPRAGADEGGAPSPPGEIVAAAAEVFESLSFLDVRSLSIPRLFLPDGGGAYLLSAALAGDGLDLELTRKSPAAGARIAAAWGPAAPGDGFSLRIRAFEAAGGPFAAAAGGPREEGARLSFAGKGPPRAWQVRLRAELGEGIALVLAGSNDEVGGSFRGTVEARAQTGAGGIGLRTGLSCDGAALRLDRLSLGGPGSELTGNLALDLETGAAEGRLAGRIEDLAPWGELLGSDLSGKAGLRARIDTAGGAPRLRLSVLGRGLAADGVRARGLALTADLSVLGRGPEGKVELRLETVEAGETVLEAAGADLTLAGDGARFRVSARGEARQKFFLEAAGSAARPGAGRGELELDYLRGAWGPYPFDLKRPWRGSFDPDGFSFGDFELACGGGSLRGGGTASARGWSAELQGDRLPLAPCSVWLGEAVSGTADLAGRLSGAPADPDADLELRLDGVGFGGDGETAAGEGNLEFSGRLERRRLQGTARARGPGGGEARAEFSVPLDCSLAPFRVRVLSGETVAGRLEAAGSLAPLNLLPLFDGQALAGDVRAEAVLEGCAGSARLRGKAVLADGSYVNDLTGTAFRNVAAEVTLGEAGEAAVELRAGDGQGGTFKLRGRVGVDPGADFPLALRAEASRFTLLREDDLTGAVSGTVDVSGTAAAPAVAGDLELGPLWLTLPERLPESIPELEVVEINRPGGAASPARPSGSAGYPSLDIRVRMPGKIFVKGWAVDSEWKGSLRVRGEGGEPSVSGVLETVRGYFDLLGKRFTIVRGRLGFNGPPNPVILIEGEAEAADIVARITVSGTYPDIRLDLQSDPPLARDEILARVLFGKDLSEITPLQALNLAAAVVSLGTGGRPGVMDKIQDRVGLDRMELRESRTRSGTETTLAVGKYLTDNVYLDLESGIGDETRKVAVEVDLTRHFSVESRVGGDLSNGIYLYWNYDY